MLIVEDGTIVASAESYVSVVDADAILARLYHPAELASWNGFVETTKEIWLRRSFEFLEAVFSGRWMGSRVNSLQRSEWPRYDVRSPEDDWYVDYNVIPEDLKIGQAKLALAMSNGADPLASDAVTSDMPRTVTSESFRIGPLSESYTYEPGMNTTGLTESQYPFLLPLLRKYLNSRGSRLIRQ